MTLEDFFTLTEMKDGLTSHTRVEELISMMLKDKDTTVTNVIEAARQWSTVASILAVTDNQASLDHFVRSDGLLFLDRWLQEAQIFGIDACDNSMEESISLLLEALKKLPIDNKRSVSSGIGVTVKKLFSHKSFRVQERARALFEGWNQVIDNDKTNKDIEEFRETLDERVRQDGGTVAEESWCLEHSAVSNTLAEQSVDGKPKGSEHRHSRGSYDSQSEGIGDVKCSVYTNKDTNHTTLSKEKKEDGFREDTQETSRCVADNTSSSGDSTQTPAEWRFTNIPKLKDVTTEANETVVGNAIPDELGKGERSPVSALSQPESVPADPASLQKLVLQAEEESNVDAKLSEVCAEKNIPASIDDNTCALATESKALVDESGKLNHLRSEMEPVGTDPTDGSRPVTSQNPSFDGCFLTKPDNRDASSSEMPDTEPADNDDEFAGESFLKGGRAYETSDSILKPQIYAEVSDNNKRSDMEFEYGIDDALEVARQVAKEVEREVVDYREQFCSSSSERKSEDGVVQPDSPVSINGELDVSVNGELDVSVNGELDQSMAGSQQKLKVREDLPCMPSPIGENHVMDSDYIATGEGCLHSVDPSQPTETLQRPSDLSKKGLCDIDLNEVCFEEMDHPTITFVSASKVVPASVPRAPIHFEGELGWKGSAATSAFRPASGHKTLDGEKHFSVEDSSQSLKQRQCFLDIDLNIADEYGDGVAHPAFGKQIPVSSGLLSGESSVEVSSRRAQRFKLDLNQVGDNEETPSLDCRMEERSRYNHRNSCPSPASSSSSKQFPVRNIDLNGNPSFVDDSNYLRPGTSKYSSLDMNASVGYKLDDPVVSILGARVSINRPMPIPQSQPLLPNGRGVESPMNAVFTRSENGLGNHHPMTYMSPPASLFGYNGFTTGSSASFSPAIYGNCMVDSRGSPVVPQMMPSSSAVAPSQPPFFMSLSGPYMNLNGLSRPNLDLNSGLTMVDGENRETGGLRQLFVQGPGMLMEEQMRSASHPMPMGLGMGAKRKEPDGGWDPYQVGYKHQQPWR